MSALAVLSSPVLAVLGQTAVPTPISATPVAAPSVVATPTISWAALLPVIVLGLGAVVLLTLTSLLKKHLPRWFNVVFTVVVALVALATVVPLWARVQGWDHLFWWDLDTAVQGPFSTFGSACGLAGPSCGAVGIDGFSLLITALICIAIALGALLASDYLRREDLDGPELYVLLLLSGAGGVVMAVANDLIVLFLGLETLSIAVYVLTAMHRKRIQSQEAGLKYFVLGGFSSAFFLYGIAMVYGATATTNLVNIRNLVASGVPVAVPAAGVGGWTPDITLNSPLLIIGLGLMLVGLGFKVAAVPFHFWAPDAYDGAPTPVTAFMAGAVKAAAFAGLVRVFAVAFEGYTSSWQPIVMTLAVLSMVGGSLAAIVQTNVKRTLAYSSINHAGFILMALAASSPEGNQAVVFYLIAYTFMVAGSFGIVALVSRRGDNRTSVSDYRGLSDSNPGLAFLFTVFLLAQAGVPFTSGFLAKLYTVIAAIQADATWLAIIGMVSSVIATFLYLRIIVSMYMSADEHDDAPLPPKSQRIRVPAGARLALAVCVIVTVGVGLFPGPLSDLAGDAKPVLVNTAEPASSEKQPATTPSGSTGEPGAAPASTPSPSSESTPTGR